MAKKKVIKESPKLVRMYIPQHRVRRFWFLLDSMNMAPEGADNFEKYNLMRFISESFNGMGLDGWGIDSDDIFSPYIYLETED